MKKKEEYEKQERRIMREIEGLTGQAQQTQSMLQNKQAELVFTRGKIAALEELEKEEADNAFKDKSPKK